MRLPTQRKKIVANEQTQLTTAIDLPKQRKATTFSTIMATFPRRIEPMLATPVDGPFDMINGSLSSNGWGSFNSFYK